jgi:hypothetical protein
MRTADRILFTFILFVVNGGLRGYCYLVIWDLAAVHDRYVGVRAQLG